MNVTPELSPEQQALRDKFAAAALPVMLGLYGIGASAEAEAFKSADRMLAARAVQVDRVVPPAPHNPLEF